MGSSQIKQKVLVNNMYFIERIKIREFNKDCMISCNWVIRKVCVMKYVP